MHYILRISLKSIQKFNNIEKKLLINKKFKKNKLKSIFQVKKKNQLFTLLKSPHVNKQSREQFIYNIYNKKIELKFYNFFKLINTIILIKKKFSENYIINIKIIKTI